MGPPPQFAPGMLGRARCASSLPTTFVMGYIHRKRTWGRKCATSCSLGDSLWMCARFGQPVVGTCPPNLNGQVSCALCVPESLHPYLIWQRVPRLHPTVYGHNTHSHHARYWARARCGHHAFADGRSARHRNTCLSTPCRFCSLGCDSLEHALLQCPVHTWARNRWHQRSRGGRCLSFRILFSTEEHTCEKCGNFERP